MKKITHMMEGFEKSQIYDAFKTLFDTYLLNRDYEKTLSYVDDDFYSVGTGKEEVVVDKNTYANLLKEEISTIPGSVKYSIDSFYAKELAADLWDVLAELHVLLPQKEGVNYVYETRFTGCFRLEEKAFRILSMHISDPSMITGEKEFFPLSYIGSDESIDKMKTEKIVFDIISKSMPGGIISGYAKEGFPIYFVNDQYLELLGYSSYEEYYEDAEGMGATHIHPDDRDMVNAEIMNSYDEEVQYGIEYRIRHKDGHYIPVYDIGKKMITPDNEEVIICVLYDMTKDAKLKEILRQESYYDNLTGVYNRNGGIKTIEKALGSVSAFSFAFFDVDNLKSLNDIYSHSAGDDALKYFAKVLQKCFDEKTILARIGGDEFIAFFEDKRDRERIISVFEKVEAEYCNFIENTYPESHSSLSIGCITGTKKRTFDEMYQLTDNLMYEIKKHGKKGHNIIELD